MPRTLSGLQTGEFDEIDVLHTVHVNGNPGGAAQVLTSDGVNSDWNDIPSQLPTGVAGQVLTSDGGTNSSFSAIPSQLPTTRPANSLLTIVGANSTPVFSNTPTVTSLTATNIGGASSNLKANLVNIDTINGVVFDPVHQELPSGTINQILTVDSDNVAEFRDSITVVDLLATENIGGVHPTTGRAALVNISNLNCTSITCPGNIGGPSSGSRAALVNIANLNCTSIICPAATISGQILGSNLPNLTIQRSVGNGGDITYNGTSAESVPAPSKLTIAHNSSDLLTYDPSDGSNVAVNIDCETLTMNVGATAYTYNTTAPQTVPIPTVLGSPNITIIDDTDNNHQQVTLDIEADIATNGNNINMANDTYGQPGGDISNARNIFMEANVGHIGSNTNRVKQIWGEFVYTRNIYAETWSNSAGNKANLLGSGGIKLQNLPTYQPVGSNTAGLLWNDQGTLKISS